MNVKKMEQRFLIRLSLVIVFLGLLLVSCNNDDEIISDENPINAKIEFKTFLEQKNLDIIAIGSSSEIIATYTWEVSDGTSSAVKYESDSEEGKGLYWGARVGGTKFCLTVKSEKYPEGITVCKTFTRTQAEVDAVNN